MKTKIDTYSEGEKGYFFIVKCDEFDIHVASDLEDTFYGSSLLAYLAGAERLAEEIYKAQP